MKNTLLFIGAGNMARAIVGGLIATGYPSPNIYVVDLNQEQVEFFRKTFQVAGSTVWQDYIQEVDTVFLSVKPQQAQSLCESLQPVLHQAPLFISIMAGLTLATLNHWLGKDVPIIRAMPNTPGLIQAGATGLFGNSHVSAIQQQQAEVLLQSIGITAWVKKESDLDIITALSGSGPAYYFYFIETMRDIAIRMGLDESIAAKFALQTAYGAAKLAVERKEDVSILRAQVSSKGGTTEKAISVMQEKNLGGLLEQAMQACAVRALTLSKELGG